MDHIQEGYKTGNSLSHRVFATCYQGHSFWQSFPSPEVRNSSKNERDALFYQVGCPVSIRPLLVVHLLIEWNGISFSGRTMIAGRHSTMFKLTPLDLGLWHILRRPMAAMVLATRMDSLQYYDQGLVPIVLSCAVCGRQLARSRVLIECDNYSAMAAVNKHYTKEKVAMHLLQSLYFFVAYYDIDVKCKHIVGVNNTTADHLSRNNLQSFFCLHPQAVLQPNPIPPPLLQILEVGAPDWTSPLFRQQFSTIIRIA